MSASANHMHGHASGHSGHDDHGDAPHGSLRGYLIGFGLSVVLTAIPFALVMTGALGSATATAAAILSMAVIQIIVHMIYFLHMNMRSEGGWSMLALIFTVVFVVITLAGSVWVMYNLNVNMMPHSMHAMPADAMSQMQ